MTEPVNLNSWDGLLTDAVKYLFDFDYPIFDTTYKEALEKKIIEALFEYEIGATPYARWKIHFMRKMRQIMPYYNQLYESAVLEFNPLYTTDYNRTFTRDNNGKSDLTSESEGTSNSKTEATTTDSSSASGGSENRSRFSDTPSGIVTEVEAGTYLTNYTYDSAESETTSSSNGTNNTDVDDSFNNSTTSSTTVNNSEEYAEHVVGKEGGQSYMELVKQLRENIINIDMMVIRDLKQTMMLIY